MTQSINLLGSTSNNIAGVNTYSHIQAIPETNAANNFANVGAVRGFSEDDDGYGMQAITTNLAPKLISCEADVDYRFRASNGMMVDHENFNYTNLDTGKYTYLITTMTNAWTTGAMVTNSTLQSAANTGTSFGTYAYFPLIATSTLAFECELSFSAYPTANTVIDFGGFVRGVINPYAPTDGAYFRLTSAGLQGVINYNGTETTTPIFDLADDTRTLWLYTPNKKNQYTVLIGERGVTFIVDAEERQIRFGYIPTPQGQARPFASTALPFSIRHAIVGGAAGTPLAALLATHSVRLGGPMFERFQGEFSNASQGSHQGASGGTMGSLANYANSINPTAAVPTNTTAALGVGLGGQFWETATLAVNTDGIICSYQLPTATTLVNNRRLKITGVGLSSYVQTAFTAGGPFVAQYSLAFGHTNVSLATTESVTAKAPRRIALPFNQAYVVTQAASTLPVQPVSMFMFASPIYVNPGEFVALVTKHIGTAVTTAGTIAHTVTFDYSWE
jgi:hypothetical protein